jgi:hypothetical protein
MMMSGAKPWINIGAPQIRLGGEGKFGKIVEGAQILRRLAGGIEGECVMGGVFISLGEPPFEPLQLQGPQAIDREPFRFVQNWRRAWRFSRHGAYSAFIVRRS